MKTNVVFCLAVACIVAAIITSTGHAAATSYIQTNGFYAMPDMVREQLTAVASKATAHAHDNSDVDDDMASAADFTVDASAGIPSGWAMGGTSDAGLWGGAQMSQPTHPSGSAYLMLDQAVDFQTLEPGQLAIELDHQMTVNLYTEYSGEWASADVHVAIGLDNLSAGTAHQADFADTWFAASGDAFILPDASTLGTSLAFDQGDVGRFWMTMQITARVWDDRIPAPSALFLGTIGTVLVGWLRRPRIQ